MKIVYSLQMRKLTLTEGLSQGWTSKMELYSVPVLVQSWCYGGFKPSQVHGLLLCVLLHSSYRSKPRPGWLQIQGSYPTSFLSRRETEKGPLTLKAIKVPATILVAEHVTTLEFRELWLPSKPLLRLRTQWFGPNLQRCHEPSSQDIVGLFRHCHQAPLFSFSSELTFGKAEGTSSFSLSPLWCPSLMFGIITSVISQESWGDHMYCRPLIFWPTIYPQKQCPLS